MDVVDTSTSSTDTSATTALSDQVLAALKEKPAPELCLDSQDLEVGENDTNHILAKLSLQKRGWSSSVTDIGPHTLLCPLKSHKIILGLVSDKSVSCLTSKVLWDFL